MLPVTILQLGDGNFLRGFVDWMVGIANGQGVMKAGIANRGGGPYPIQDDAAVIATLGAAWATHGTDPKALVHTVLADATL